ncbi:MAG: hypothetical protein WA081_16565 [Desulfosalsimonadaceae bacterium]
MIDGKIEGMPFIIQKYLIRNQVQSQKAASNDRQQKKDPEPWTGPENRFFPRIYPIGTIDFYHIFP